jgi:hypothetical protein
LAEPLFFFDGAEVETARGARGRGERVIAFSEAAARRLGNAGIPFSRSVEALGDDPEMPLYRAAADWTRAFGTMAMDANGQTLKEALRYRETTLWWWAELYLHHNTDAARRVRFLETVARALDTFPTAKVRTHGLTSDETALTERLCAARHLAFVDGPIRKAGVAARRSALVAGLFEASKVVATAIKGTGGGGHRLTARSVVFVTHAAFWKERTAGGGEVEPYEHYFDSLLRESKRRGLPVGILAVGPQNVFRTRSTSDRWKERLSSRKDDRFVHINHFVSPGVAALALKAFGKAVTIHRRLRGAPGLARAFSHRGVTFADLSAEDFGRTLLHQVPWAARCLLEFDAAFRELDPRLVCLYAESSGLGRAAIEGARALKVRTLGIQHGILYPNYFSYERTAGDVALGTPIPDRTAMYGEDGVRLLETTFRYPTGRVVATGSPRYDALSTEIRTVNREERRKNLGIAASDHLVVLASRYAGIRETHKASGPVFASLLGAIGGMEGARLIVKPHPAEPAGAYDKDIATAALGDRVRVIADRSLTDLLPASDLLVTVESLSATEALVAGVPVVVLRHPSNLRDLVASGAAVGVPDGEDPRPSIEALLTNAELRARWRESRDAFLGEVAHGVDGKSLDRLVALVSQMAGLD